MTRKISQVEVDQLNQSDSLTLPNFTQNLETVLSEGKSLKIEGTNVIRVPFGVRRSKRQRPERPERWATLVLPLQPLDTPTPPPQAA